jgi:hypothetical protein
MHSTRLHANAAAANAAAADAAAADDDDDDQVNLIYDYSNKVADNSTRTCDEQQQNTIATGAAMLMITIIHYIYIYI